MKPVVKSQGNQYHSQLLTAAVVVQSLTTGDWTSPQYALPSVRSVKRSTKSLFLLTKKSTCSNTSRKNNGLPFPFRIQVQFPSSKKPGNQTLLTLVSLSIAATVLNSICVLTGEKVPLMLLIKKDFLSVSFKKHRNYFSSEIGILSCKMRQGCKLWTRSRYLYIHLHLYICLGKMSHKQFYFPKAQFKKKYYWHPLFASVQLTIEVFLGSM